jgi:hypothetical protein
MIKVVFYSNYSSSYKLLDSYKTWTPGNMGIWNNICGVIDINNADCVIFLEAIPNGFDLTTLTDKIVICFPREPFGNKNWKKYNGFTYDNYYHVVTNPAFINKNYDFLNNLKYIPSVKNKKFSAVISNKNFGHGYQQRRLFLIKMASMYPNLCDIYGKGWGNELGTSYKGELECYHTKNDKSDGKFPALINYNYSLCIENCSKKNYFTEKFTDCILSWCIPIYYGCTNISEYFPEGSYYEIDITNSNCIENIINIINTPISQKNIEALKEARDLVMNKYNVWSSIESVINNKTL